MAANTNYKRYINEELAKSLVKDIHTFVQDEDSSLAARVRTDLQLEVAWRKAADKKLDEKLNKETELRIADVGNEETRATMIEGNLSDLTTADKSNLVNAINSEVTRAKNVEGELDQIPLGIKTPTANGKTTIDLATAIKNENTRAISEETRIGSKLDNEIERATTTDGDLLNIPEEIATPAPNKDKIDLAYAIKNEYIRAKEAESGLQTQIINNDNRAIAAEGDLKSKDWTSTVNYSEEVDKTDLAVAIYTEHKRAVKSEGDLSDLESLFTANTGKVSKEAADAQWSNEVPNLSNAIISSSMLDVKLDSDTTQNITGGLNITDGVIVDTLTVTNGISTDNVSVTGETDTDTLNVNKSATIGELTTGNTNVVGDLSVTGITSFAEGAEATGGNIEATGDLKIGNDANITGDVSATNINAASQVTAKDIITDTATITNSLTVKDLNVTGKTTTVDAETLAVKDNLIITNSGKETLTTADSGLAINKNATETYGIVYNPTNDSVNLGIGSLDENNNFAFNEGEGLPIVVRDGLVDNNFILYSEEGYKVIDSGISKTNYEDKVTRLGQAETNIAQLRTDLTAETSKRQAQDAILQANIINEEARATGIETDLKSSLTSEITRAKSAESVLTQNINKEVNDRIEADNQLQININNEKSDREIADIRLLTNINSEETRAIAEEGTLLTYINREVTRAIAAENTKAPINHKSETTDYGVADKDNYGHVKTDVLISKTSTNVMQTGALYEYLNRLNTDDVNPKYLPTAETYVKALVSYLADTFCTDAEAEAIRVALQTQIDTNKDNLAAEITRAQGVEGNLSFNTGLNHITNLTGAINAENSRAKEAEMSLSTRLDILEAVPDDGRLYVVHWEDDTQNGRILKWTTLDEGELD